jgi:Rad3-related DNA helicase
VLNSILQSIGLPGKYRTMSLIDKIPFPRRMAGPRHPISSIWKETASSLPSFNVVQGRLKLAQAVGRLIRIKAEDCWILSRRVVEKSYGRRLIQPIHFRLLRNSKRAILDTVSTQFFAYMIDSNEDF